MAYVPKNNNKSEIEALALAKLKEILDNVNRVESCWVDPGDVVLVHVNPEMKQDNLTMVRHIFSSIFPDNKIVIVEDGQLELKILKPKNNDI